ncbi:hypothetical protein BGZ61DRAFT_577338 [Ilyonectria robusta]|uniref:uncharacterized protein n=1 Tax=Ilyonectria robusta TaxID=1079257 RepID=UPI001E8E21FF|nr:uncharacterized protein BGZ61DRAFT_577338 [Ilyonectria robusta]KAH8699876.1 hypothetical protein BGZ61DRAFT_577338 [Ilyonectria robusta]
MHSAGPAGPAKYAVPRPTPIFALQAACSGLPPPGLRSAAQGASASASAGRPTTSRCRPKTPPQEAWHGIGRISPASRGNLIVGPPLAARDVLHNAVYPTVELQTSRASVEPLRREPCPPASSNFSPRNGLFYFIPEPNAPSLPPFPNKQRYLYSVTACLVNYYSFFLSAARFPRPGSYSPTEKLDSVSD